MERTVVTRSAKARMSTETVDAIEPLTPVSSVKRSLDSTEPAPDSSSTKRAKTASQSFAKHSRFWALDGNVVVQFGAIAFKLHRSRLSTQSVWFEKLFEKRAGREEPLEEDEKNIESVVVEDMDGIGIYHLDSIGTVKDFEALLTAMEDAIDLFYRPPRFLTAAAIFRAATTYKFHKFVQFTRQYLLDAFSDDLGAPMNAPIPNAVAAVVLGRTWKLPGILKRAFYELLRSQPETAPRPDDDEIHEGENPLEALEMADIIRLSDAQKHLTMMWLTVLPPPLTASTCSAKPPCPATRYSGAWTTKISEVVQGYRLDPLSGLDSLLAVHWTSVHGFCKSCARKQMLSFKTKKEEIWDGLDTWFAIPVDEEDDDEESQ
ncbi:hypothetical protein C8R47DRAFT_1056120 [Mycena vitilis]|nr:hypothetical protein C8R47DRAFT_1056120 [Mycena vitilis]